MSGATSEYSTINGERRRMPIQLNDIEALQDYTIGVMARAEHHAKQVRAIILAMLGGIIWRVDPGSIEIRYHDGDLANALCWNSVSGGKYACAYDHSAGAIEIRDRSGRGSALHSFTNATPVEEVERVFSTL
jgi:Integron cassette protein VCH_CASS1 chain